MISREIFLSTLDKIRRQDARIEEFEDALQKLCDIRPAFDQGNLYLEALLELLQYTTNDKSDVIGWWLYEAPKDDSTISWIEDGVEISRTLSSLDALYDYLCEVNNPHQI